MKYCQFGSVWRCESFHCCDTHAPLLFASVTKMLHMRSSTYSIYGFRGVEDQMLFKHMPSQNACINQTRLNLKFSTVML